MDERRLQLLEVRMAGGAPPAPPSKPTATAVTVALGEAGSGRAASAPAPKEVIDVDEERDEDEDEDDEDGDDDDDDDAMDEDELTSSADEEGEDEEEEGGRADEDELLSLPALPPAVAGSARRPSPDLPVPPAARTPPPPPQMAVPPPAAGAVGKPTTPVAAAAVSKTGTTPVSAATAQKRLNSAGTDEAPAPKQRRAPSTPSSRSGRGRSRAKTPAEQAAGGAGRGGSRSGVGPGRRAGGTGAGAGAGGSESDMSSRSGGVPDDGDHPSPVKGTSIAAYFRPAIPSAAAASSASVVAPIVLAPVPSSGPPAAAAAARGFSPVRPGPVASTSTTGESAPGAEVTRPPSMRAEATSDHAVALEATALRAQIAQLETTASNARHTLAERDRELQRAATETKRVQEDLQAAVKSLKRSREALSMFLRKKSEADRRAEVRRISELQTRLLHQQAVRVTGDADVYGDGYAIVELQDRQRLTLFGASLFNRPDENQRDLANELLLLEKRRRSIMRRRQRSDTDGGKGGADSDDENFPKPASVVQPAAAASAAGGSAAGGAAGAPAADGAAGPVAGIESPTEELAALDCRMINLKREEVDVAAALDRLKREKDHLIRAAQLLQSEERSRFFMGGRILGSRYQLLRMLGRGGFSEVFLAYDLHNNTEVALKLHHVSDTWPSQRQTNYVKHALREHTIHKSLRHPRVVSLLDVFEVDDRTIATVLEFCNGQDLDEYLRQRQQIPEKEARLIIMQVVSGLRYLNEIRPAIIHYDLKPANILIHDGNIRITDFGLSKVMDAHANSEGMELTSQGAGTYWYLPPECFEQSPHISSKVDVWSVGVIFFQMLYQKRPFGHDMSQQRILQEGIITNARTVSFPDRPTVSSETKEFISLCLTHAQRLRPDVRELADHPYLKATKR